MYVCMAFSRCQAYKRDYSEKIVCIFPSDSRWSSRAALNGKRIKKKDEKYTNQAIFEKIKANEIYYQFSPFCLIDNWIFSFIHLCFEFVLVKGSMGKEYRNADNENQSINQFCGFNADF